MQPGRVDVARARAGRTHTITVGKPVSRNVQIEKRSSGGAVEAQKVSRGGRIRKPLENSHVVAVGFLRPGKRSVGRGISRLRHAAKRASIVILPLRRSSARRSTASASGAAKDAGTGTKIQVIAASIGARRKCFERRNPVGKPVGIVVLRYKSVPAGE